MDYIGKICPYCKTEIKAGDDVVICSSCEMPHHKDCWIENRGCTTFGCTGTIQGINHQSPNTGQNTGDSTTIYCTRCGKATHNMNRFCPYCGNILVQTAYSNPSYNTYNQCNANNVQPQNNSYYYQSQSPNYQYGMNYQYGVSYQYGGYSQPNADNSDYINLIQQEAPFYIAKFSQMKASSSSASWNWCSFLFGAYWFFYRKMYGVGCILAASSLIGSFLSIIGPVMILVLSVMMGIYGNSIYMKFADREISQSSNMSPYEKQMCLDRRGGTSVGSVFGLFFGMVLIILIGAIAASSGRNYYE
jgi:hypothetical protein